MTTRQDPPTCRAKEGITYEPLEKDQIRLLKVFPSCSEEAELECSLESFDSPPPYIALSYTWGDRTDTRKLLVDGQIFEATKNLEEALNHLRHKKEKLYFWVDAICINQTHEKEKQHQLQMIPIIFSQAQETRVWLGPEKDGSNQAIDLMHTLSDLHLEGFGKTEPKWESSGASRPWTHADLVALHHLFQRDYWYRVWVVQEIAMSKNIEIFCGLNQLSWHSLLNAIELMMTESAIGLAIDNDIKRVPLNGFRLGRQRIVSIQSVRNDKLQLESAEERPPDSLLYLLSSHRVTKASEARDKYYAIAGLVSEDESIISRRFSAKSIEDIYVLAAESTTKELGHNHLDFLDFAGWPTNISGLPSWVPDWSSRGDRAVPLLYYQLAGMKHKDMVYLNAPGSRSPSLSKTFVFRSKEKCLCAQGFEFDTINGVGYSRWWPYTESPNPQNAENPLEYGNQPYPIGDETLADVIWRTFVLNRSHTGGLRAPAGWGDLFYHILFRSGGDALWYRQNKDFKVHGVTLERIAQHQRELKPDFQMESRSSTDEVTNLITAFDIANRYRRLATTKKGYLCLAPSISQPGDLVVILFDCQIPVVLRRKDNHFIFIGTCYVHGIMQGEAMAGLSNQKPTWFEIR